MATLHGHVMEQVAFQTQMPHNLCCRVVKIILQSYLEQSRLAMGSCVYNFLDHQEILPMRS
jgi:hypothetical protein